MTAPAAPPDAGGTADDASPSTLPPTGFLRRRVFSTDHKVIAKQFLCLGLVFLAVGGVMAMLIRWQWAQPGPAGAAGRAGCCSAARAA